MDPNQSNKTHVVMKSSTLICCKLYISESRNTSALDSIERAAKLDPEAAIVNKFQDRAYNRVRYTLVSYAVHDAFTNTTYTPMRQTLLAMVEAAYDAVNLEMHLGAHPRLGVVDQISFHPLAQATLEDAARVAKLVASDIGNGLQVPVFLYEAAHPTWKALDTIRRELGYYRPNFMGNQWAGWASNGGGMIFFHKTAVTIKRWRTDQFHLHQPPHLSLLPRQSRFDFQSSKLKSSLLCKRVNGDRRPQMAAA